MPPVVPATPAPLSSPVIPATLTLADAQNVALANSPALAVARAQVDQSRAGIGLAQAGELPTVSGQASTTHARFPFGTRGGTAGGSVSGSSFSISNGASINVRQLVLDGGRVRAQVNAAQFSTDASQLALQRQMQVVLLSVAQSYFAALQARHTYDTARESLRLAQVQAKLVEAQFRAGVAARADVLTAQLPVAQAQLAVAQASTGERTQIAALLNVMGLPSQTKVNLADDTRVAATLPDVDTILATANRQRPDLLAAQASSQAAEASLRAARLGRFPQVSANASSGTTSTTQLGSNYGNEYSFGVSLNVPIFDGGLTRAQVGQAQAQADIANANLRAIGLNVSQSVEQAYSSLVSAQAGVVAANAELAQAQTVLDVTNAQYRAGVTTLPLLLNAQVGLVRARNDQTNALYTYKVAQQNLLFAEGTLGQ